MNTSIDRFDYLWSGDPQWVLLSLGDDEYLVFNRPGSYAEVIEDNELLRYVVGKMLAAGVQVLQPGDV